MSKRLSGGNVTGPAVITSYLGTDEFGALFTCICVVELYIFLLKDIREFTCTNSVSYRTKYNMFTR